MLSMGANCLSILLIVIATIIWGTTGVVAKYCFNMGVSPEELLVLRLGLTVPFYLYYALRRGVEARTLLLGLLLLGPYHIVYFNAINMIGVSTTVLLFYTYPVIVAIASMITLNEEMGIGEVAALILSITGSSLTSLGELSLNPMGVALALLSSLLYAAYIVYSKKILVEGEDPLGVALGSSTGALVPVLLAYISRGAHVEGFLRPSVIMSSLYLSLVVTILGYLLYMKGLRSTNASIASMLSSMEPFTATILSTLIFHEPLTLAKITGGALIIFATILISHVHTEASSPQPNI